MLFKRRLGGVNDDNHDLSKLHENIYFNLIFWVIYQIWNLN